PTGAARAPAELRPWPVLNRRRPQGVPTSWCRLLARCPCFVLLANPCAFARARCPAWAGLGHRQPGRRRRPVRAGEVAGGGKPRRQISQTPGAHLAFAGRREAEAPGWQRAASLL